MSFTSAWNSLLRILRTAVIAIATFASLIAVLIVGIEIHDRMPVHPVSAHCYQSRVHFKGPKSERFNKFYIKLIEEWDQPYSIRNGIINTTGYGSGDDNMNKFIQNNIRPEWFSDNPTFDTPEQKAIVERWRKTSARENLQPGLLKEWCHVIEAAIAKDGIDVEARREHPSIWPPHEWPIPPQD